MLITLSQGINAYLDSPNLPLEFKLIGFNPEPWTPADVLVWQKLMSLDLSMNMGEEIQRLTLNVTRGLSRERIAELWPDYPPDGPLILPSYRYPNTTTKKRGESSSFSPKDEFFHYDRIKPIQTQSQSETPDFSPLHSTLSFLKHITGYDFSHTGPRASNNWVVHGNLTATNKPFLANDPHLGFSVPSIWILFHISCPTIEAIGATFAGMPGVVIGRNRDIAWGVTNVGADVQDLYILEEGENENSYMYHNQSMNYTIRREVIKIRDDKDYELLIKETLYGPVISDAYKIPIQQKVALRWTALDGNDTTYVENLFLLYFEQDHLTHICEIMFYQREFEIEFLLFLLFIN
jgi:penicillin amidase